MFGVAEAALATPAPRVLLCGLKGRIVAIADQMPDAPTPLTITRPALGDEQSPGRALTITQATETASPRIAAHPQRLELAPLALDEDLDVLFGADDETQSLFCLVNRSEAMITACSFGFPSTKRLTPPEHATHTSCRPINKTTAIFCHHLSSAFLKLVFTAEIFLRLWRSDPDLISRRRRGHARQRRCGRSAVAARASAK